MAVEPPVGETLDFTSGDGTALSGVWYGSGDRVVILSHQNGLGQDGWAPLLPSLLDAGYAVMTYNFRGYPPSAGRQVGPELGGDLSAAVALARSRGAGQVALIGASMGAMATIEGAVAAEADAIVLLSAPRRFDGVQIDDAELQFPIPKLFLYAKQDGGATAAKMVEAAAEPKDVQAYEGGFHGLLMLFIKEQPDLKQRIVDFLVEQMPPA